MLPRPFLGLAHKRIVRSKIVASQVDLHAKYGGVVPEIASRALGSTPFDLDLSFIYN